ncbi:MAG: hypothetical protein OER96_10510 [Gammaproteobacteria bacterium]|nr:hypothetical protein [Gammaproteobacteria bacterium]
MSDSNVKIYFHVGLGKAASTYLQHSVFPIFQDIHYIHRNRYRSSTKIIARGEYTKYLLSREFTRGFENKLSKFLDRHPDAYPIIVFRRHDEWIASQYRRYVKNGGTAEFEGFIDIDNNKGIWSKSELEFYARIETLERCFGRPPLVLFYEDMREDAFTFFDTLARYMGANYDRNQLPTRAVHKSYTDKQLHVTRGFCRWLFKSSTRNPQDAHVGWARKRLRMLGCYCILYPAAAIPESWTPKQPLINSESLTRIRKTYTDDWKKCREYARCQNL